MLKLENVSAGYNGTDVIHDISFRLSEGESLCILGPNSCGKTTLLRAIAKLIESNGVLELDGQSVHAMRRKRYCQACSCDESNFKSELSIFSV